MAENQQFADDEEALQNSNRVSDNDAPTAPADDIRSASPIDEPSTDDGIDSDELYQEGLAGATNADDKEVGPTNELSPLEPED